VPHHTAASSAWTILTATEEDIVACSVLGQLAWLASILECLQLAACQPHQQPETLHKCTSILLAVKRYTFCTSILLAVERDTPCMPILGGGERDAQCTSKVHDPDARMPEKNNPASAFRHQGQSSTGGHA
jgi:hypothetical protein